MKLDMRHRQIRCLLRDNSFAKYIHFHPNSNRTFRRHKHNSNDTYTLPLPNENRNSHFDGIFNEKF